MALLAEHRVVLDASAEEVYRHLTTVQGILRWMAVDELASPDFLVYVTCFCESTDLLSQWRAYGSDHGYAIEFSANALESSIAQVAAYDQGLAQVRYGDTAATEVASQALRDLKPDSNLGHVGVHAHNMALQLTSRLAGVKHPGFREEREWRLFATFDGFLWQSASPVRYRATAIAIVPYIAVRFPKDAIKSIQVGPGRHVDVRVQGVRHLLGTLEIDAEVTSSSLPLRS
jgi:hypothetical protein